MIMYVVTIRKWLKYKVFKHSFIWALVFGYDQINLLNDNLEYSNFACKFSNGKYTQKNN